MPDQADNLRRLMCSVRPPAEAFACGPPMVAVTGGKGGVGATTVAINLAAALVEVGRRVVLVDAARQHGDLAHMAGIDVPSGPALGDVLSGECSASEALGPGPAGMLLLADHWAANGPADWSTTRLQRLVVELQNLGPHADLVVVDAGSGVNPWTTELWRHARLVLAVTTVDDLAVMDTYATIKLGSRDVAVNSDIRVLANQCDSQRAAVDVHRRIANVCRRFLGRTVDAAPTLPVWVDVDCDALSPPRVWEAPRSPFARSVSQLAGTVAEATADKVAQPAAEAA